MAPTLDKVRHASWCLMNANFGFWPNIYYRNDGRAIPHAPPNLTFLAEHENDAKSGCQKHCQQNNAKCKIRSWSDPSGRKSAALAGAARSVGAEALSSVPLRPLRRPLLCSRLSLADNKHSPAKFLSNQQSSAALLQTLSAAQAGRAALPLQLPAQRDGEQAEISAYQARFR